MPLSPLIKSAVASKLEEYEGRYNHFYLDTTGKFTVGVGHLIPNRVAVTAVMLYTTKNGVPMSPATLKQKQDEYDNIIKQKRNYRASWYKQFCTLVMKDADIDFQRDNHISSFYKELTVIYSKANGYQSNFDNMPPEVQKALFDMIFNLGATRLTSVFTKFNSAVKQDKWDEAARQCNRPDVSPTRNNYVKGLFNTAHTTAAASAP